MLLPWVLAVLSAAPVAPAEVAWPSLDFTELQWLGAGANGIAVRELRMPDLGEEKLCAYPGVVKLSEPAPAASHTVRSPRA